MRDCGFQSSQNLKHGPITNFQHVDYAHVFSTIAFIAFIVRDGFSGPIRFYLSKSGLGVLAFTPDGLAILAFFIFIWLQILRRNFLGLFVVVSFLFSVGVSVVFMNDNLQSFFSSTKMFMPIFVGFCFLQNSFTENSRVRLVLTSLFILSCTGLILAPHVAYPWLTETVTAFGIEKDLSRTWWTGGEIRPSGFSNDSTAAAFVTVFLFALISPYLSIVSNIMFASLAWYAVTISTSKTALGVLGIYLALYILFSLFRDKKRRIDLQKLMARLSFLTLLVPAMLIFLFAGVEPMDVPTQFASMLDRINNTWLQPFIYLKDNFPAGLFIGCGVGCFAYPMDYTALEEFRGALDNFYLTTFVMLGYPAILIIIMLFASIRVCNDPIRLTLIVLFNVYAITIQSYGLSTCLVFFGYMFSTMFTMPVVQARKDAEKASGRGGYSSLMR